MGELIDLTARLADRSRPSRRSHVAFFFDLASPISYLASERVERMLGDIEWIPTASCADIGAGRSAEAQRIQRETAMAEAEHQALSQRLPLVWPERVPLDFRLATRAAAYAAEMGRAGQFALAAGRLAFCGGFDLDDPEILADAAAAAGISPGECLNAAGDSAWDAQPQATAAGLARRGVPELPAIRVGRAWVCGARAVGEAAALVSAMGADSRVLSRG